MTRFTFIRYFVPDSDEFAPGWYQTRNEGRTRIGDVPLSLSDALYDGPNRVIIDDNTPETNTLPVSGGKGVDEFLITSDANTVTINDDSGANVIVFERDVVITSIERQAGSEGASVAQYVITLSSGKTITLRNPASFTFQHLGDATRTDPISAEDFFTAYEDGFAASDASHPDIIGDASGPSGVQGPIITSDPPTASRNEFHSREETVTGTLSVTGTIDSITFVESTNFDERRDIADGKILILTTYGRLTFDPADSTWSYAVRPNPIRAAPDLFIEGFTYTDVFTFAAGGVEFDLTLTITGENDPFVLSNLGNSFKAESFYLNTTTPLGDPLSDRSEVTLKDLFSDPDNDISITFVVYVADTVTDLINDSPNNVKVYDSTDPSQTLEEAIGLTYDPVTTRISGTFKYREWYGFDVTATNDQGETLSVLVARSVSGTANDNHRPVIRGASENTAVADNDQQGTAAGVIVITDGDSPHPATFPTITLVSGAGTYGTMTFDGRTWTYTVDNDDPDTQALAGGDKVNETFTFRASGASDFIVTIRVIKDPPPVINGVDNTPALTAGDDAAKTATGIVTVNDEDELDLTQLPGVVLTNEGHDGTNVQEVGPTMSLKGTYGTLTFTPIAGPPPGGTWVYTLDNEDPDTLALGDGETGEDEFILRAEGARDFAVLVTVIGVDDAPRINVDVDDLVVKAGNPIDIDLLDLFRDPEGGNLTVTVTLGDGAALTTVGLVFNQEVDLGGTVIARNIVNEAPVSAGTYTIRVTATDEGGLEGTTAFTIIVRDALQIISYFPSGGGLAEGWYRENDDGSRGGAANVSLAALNDKTPSRVVIDGNTPPNAQAVASIAFKGGRDSEVVDGGNQGLIITAKTVGAVGNNITVEFEISTSNSGSGVDDITVTNKAIKFVLLSGGASFAQIKAFFVERTDPGPTAARELIDLTIADGMQGAQINVSIEATALSGGSTREGRTASIVFGDVQDSEVANVAGDRDLIITAKTAGVGGNNIKVEFEIDGGSDGNGVESIEVSGRTIKFVLKLGGATLADIKTFLDDDGSVGAVAARALVNIRIADGKDAAEINTAVVATALSGGVAASPTIQQGLGNDEFFIKADASSVIIHDPWDKSSIIFDENVVIESIVKIQVNRGGEVGEVPPRGGVPVIVLTPGPVTDFIITLSSGNTITIQDALAMTSFTAGSNPEPRYNFLHDADESLLFRGANSFFNAYKDGFHPDFTQTVITGDTRAEVDPDSGYFIAGVLTVVDPDVPAEQLPEIMFVDSDARSLTGIYGTLTVVRMQGDSSKFNWNYVQNNNDPETIALRDGEKAAERFTLTAGNSEDFVLEITVIGRNNIPVANLDFDVDLTGTVGEAVSIDLSTIAFDPDGDALNINVEIFTPSGDPASDLMFDSDDGTITGIPTAVGTYTAQVTVTEERFTLDKTLLIEIEAQPILGDNTGVVLEDSNVDTATGSLTLVSSLTITLVDHNNSDNPSNSGVEGTYGTMTFDPSNNTWTYTLDNTDADTNALKDTPGMDVFTFTATGTSFDVTITVAGANDAPVLSGTSLSGKRGTVGQTIETITDTELNSLFSDPDTGDVLAFVVTLDDGSALSTIGLSYTAGTGITGDLLSSLTASTYTIKVGATDSGTSGSNRLESDAATFDFVVAAQEISGDNVGSVTEDDAVNNSARGTLSALGQIIRLDGGNNLGRADGTYGQMRFDARRGQWTYTLDNNNLETNKLAENTTAEDIFTFSAGTSSYTVTITVSGANDAPVVATAIDSQSGTEGQESRINLANLFSDPDTGDTLRLTFVVMRNNTDVTSTVTHSYTNDILSITPPSEGTYTVIVTASDRPGGSGLTATSTFTLEAEAQSIDGDATGEVTEDDPANNSDTGTLTAGALLITLVDPNNSDTGSVEGTYGVMTFDGTIWTYTLDNTDVDTQALAAGEEGEDSFSFATGSGRFTVVITVHGENDAPRVTMIDDDTPVSIKDQNVQVSKEITPINLSGLFTDVDGDELSLSFEVRELGSNVVERLSDIGLTHETTDSTTGESVSRIIGTPTITGRYRITVIATDGSMEDDGNGGERPVTAESTFSIFIRTDMPPIIRDASDNALTSGVGAVMEDGTPTAEGRIAISDPDGDPTPPIVLDGANTNTGILAGQYGMMAFVEAIGVWTYTLDNNHTMVQGLGDGETLTETFTFTALGAENFDVEITITGANDDPVLLSNAEPPNETVTKGLSIETDDLRSFFTDQDTNDELTLTVTFSDGAALDTIGLTYDGSSGRITGAPDTSGDFMVRAVASDGTANAADALTFTITVTEHEITGTATGSVTEDDQSSSSVRGTLTASEGLTIALQGGNGVLLSPDGSGSTLYGSMRFDASTSEWVYVLGNANEATQNLAAGQTVDEVFTFAAGEDTHDVTITVTGVNDAPVVATAIEPQIGVEGQEKVIDLSTLFTDIDTGDTLTLSIAVELAGTEIVFDGSINIISDPNASKMLRITLADTGTYTVTVVADDSNGGTVSSSFNLEVVADTPPVIGIPGSEDRAGAGSVTEDGPLTATGVLEVTDIDNPPILPAIELEGDGVGTYGTMTFDGSSWTYTLAVTPEQGGKTQALNEGQIETETFTFRAGGATFEVTITVTGVNDVPVVGTAITNKTGTINLPIAEINLSDAFTDVDENDTLTLALTVTFDGTDDNTDNGIEVVLATNGSTITFGDTGLTYNTETNILSGSPSTIGTYTIKIVATDSAGESSAETEFDIVIVHQTISGDDTGSVTEGGASGDDNTGELTAPGSTITLVSKETTDSPGMSTGTYGVMAFDGTTWTYTLDDRAEVLADGQTATESFTFTTGGEAFVVTITITGVNDAPVVGTAITNKTGTINLPIAEVNLGDAFTDADENDTLTLALTVTFDGTDDNTDNGIEVVLATNGSTTTLGDTGLTYNTETHILSGSPSAVGTYKIKIVATDSAGESSAETEFDIVIAHQTISGDETGSVTEGGAPGDDNTGELTAPGSTITLVSKEITDSPGTSTGTYGVMAFDGTTWTYTLDDRAEALGDQQTATESFTFTTGGEAFVVTITITGVNDAPVVGTAITNKTGTINQPIAEINLSDAFTDADENDTLTLALTVTFDGTDDNTDNGIEVALTPNGSTITLGDTGLTYNTETHILSGSPSAVGTYKIKIVATDSAGESSAETEFDIVIASQTISGDETGSVTEGGAPGDDNTGELTAPGSTITLVSKEATDSPGTSTGTYGVMTFDGTTWTYTLDERAEALGDLQTATETFTFRAGGATFEVTITVTGVNDAPVVGTAITNKTGTINQPIAEINLGDAFTDADENDTLTLALTVTFDGTDDNTDNGIEVVLATNGSTITLGDTGLTYNTETNILSGSPRATGTYKIKIVATDSAGESSAETEFDIVIEPQTISGDDTGSVTEGGAPGDDNTGTLTASGTVITLVAKETTDSPGMSTGTYGVMTLDGTTWTYTLDDRAEALGDQQTATETFTFRAGGAIFEVTITVTGVNDAPVVGTAITNKTGTINQPIAEINLGDAFTDVDENDTLTLALTVTFDGTDDNTDNGIEVVLATNGSTITLGDTGLTYNTETHILSGNPRATGTYKIKIVATDSAGESSAETEFDIVIAPQTISGDETGSVTEGGASGDDNTGELTAPGNTITLVSKEITDSPGMSTGTYGVMMFDVSSGEWIYTLDERAEALAEQQTETETFTFRAGGATFEVTITVTGVNDAPVVSTPPLNIRDGIDETIKPIDPIAFFTDIDGDELTFTVTLDDGTPLSTIGLTYDDPVTPGQITGTLSQIGEHIIKIVADDGNGGTAETTFTITVQDIPEIQRNSLIYNPDETSITIDDTILKITSENQSDPALLVYTITTLPDVGMLLKSGTPLNNGDTFTQADINNGLITYEPSVTTPSTSQSNPLSFTFSDGMADLEEQTLQITSREVFVDEIPAEDNTIDQSSETTPQKIEAGDGSDIITGGTSDDQIDGGAGDDEIKLTRTTVNNAEEDAGADEVLYAFDYDGVGIDGGDEIVGFKRGQDKLTFVIEGNFNSLTEFLESLNGDDQTDLTADDAFIVTMQWGTDEAGAFYFDGVLLHFKEGTSFGGGRVSSPVVQITFDERLVFNDLVEILGGAKAAENFDFTHAAFKNLDEVLPHLFGEGSIGFKGVAPSGTNGASERASEEPLDSPIYETLSEQLDDDLQPTSFELGGGETDII